MLVDAPTRVRHGVVAFTLALIAVAYLDRVCIATAAPAIKSSLGLTDTQMGIVFSAFTLAYALCEVPSGWFADRFGARITLTRIVVWWSLMTAISGLAWGFASLVAIRLLFGIGEAGAFPATARVYVRWLPPSERGRVFGLAIMTGAFAGAATQPLVVALLAHMSWRTVFALLGSVGVLWAAGWWGFFRDHPRDHPWVNESERRVIGEGHDAAVVRAHTPVPWALLARSRTLIALCAMYTGAIYGWYFYLTWLPTYLLRGRGFDLAQVGWLAALPLIGIGLGVFFGGWLSDGLSRRFGSRVGRRLAGLVGFPLAALAVVGAVVTPTPINAALLLAVAAGLAALGVAPAWAVCLEIGGAHAGVVSGVMNTFGNLGGALSPVVVGICLERWASWQAPLLSVAALYLVAAAAWLMVDPTRPIEAEGAA